MKPALLLPVCSLRRKAVIALAASLAIPAMLARAGDSGRIHRVAVVFWRIPVAELTGAHPRFPGAEQLRDSLRELGWIEGKNLELLWRSAQGSPAQADRVFAELVDARVDLMAVSGNDLIRRAIRRTKSIPIVMLVSTAPVAAGFVASATRPGGNVTGMVFQDAPELNGKRLALLKEAAPGTSKVAVLLDRTGGMTGGVSRETAEAARNLGLVLLPYAVDNQGELEASVRDAAARGANALFVDTSLAAAAKDQPAFHALAARYRLPALYTYALAVQSGGLLFYGPKPGELYRRTAHYIDRILRGARPAEMPIEQPRVYALHVNRKAAAAIGLELPPSLLAQADEVVD